MTASIAVVGVGGAGSRIAAKAAVGLGRQAHVAAVNTDARELDSATCPVKIQIGRARTGGLGAGGAPGMGRLAVEDDLATVREILLDRDIVMVVAGLGGGTGSGATPAILRAASEAGAVAVAVVTLPFAFEGPERQDVANDALRSVREAADTVIVVANDRLLEATGQTAVRACFEQADDILGRSMATLGNLVSMPGYIRLDIADLREMAKRSGDTCSLGFGEASGPDRTRRAIEMALQGTMLEQGRLVSGAAALLIGIVGGEDLAVQEVGRVMEAVAASRGKECQTFMGTHIDPNLVDTVRLLVLVSEHWDRDVPLPAAAAETPAAGKPARRSTRSRAKSTQPTLALGVGGRGRFKNVEPTILDGEDVDVPTFLRRGIRI